MYLSFLQYSALQIFAILVPRNSSLFVQLSKIAFLCLVLFPMVQTVPPDQTVLTVLLNGFLFLSRIRISPVLSTVHNFKWLFYVFCPVFCKRASLIIVIVSLCQKQNSYHVIDFKVTFCGFLFCFVLLIRYSIILVHCFVFSNLAKVPSLQYLSTDFLWFSGWKLCHLLIMTVLFLLLQSAWFLFPVGGFSPRFK